MCLCVRVCLLVCVCLFVAVCVSMRLFVCLVCVYMMKCRQTDMTDGLTDRRGSNKHTDRWTDKSIGVTINIT